jgi:TPR repeat protein
MKKEFSSKRIFALTIAAILFWFVPLTVPAQVTTNVARHWPPLEEVLEKWNAEPLEAVQQAAEGGELTAQHYLGFIYSNGGRVVTDGPQAVKWYLRAGNAGYAPSFNNLGLMYQRGVVVPHDHAKMLEYYHRSAEAGNAQAELNLGIIYRDGAGIARDYGEAMKWFRRAAAGGNVQALALVGRLYRFGHGVARDPAEAIKWFNQGAAQGDALAELNLGLLYEAEGNVAEARKFFHRAAEQGDPEAMLKLHDIYEKGVGVKKDRITADRWLLQSAETGNARAQTALAYHHRYPSSDSGNRVGDEPASMAEAVKWYQRAAEQGWSPAQYNLAECYLEGTGVELDEVRGLELMRAAADDGHWAATVALASLYARGIGEPRGAGDAILQLLLRVATNRTETGYGPVREACEELIIRYQYGIGTPRDLVAAATWYCRGVAAGNYDYSLKDKVDYSTSTRRAISGWRGLPARNGIMLIETPGGFGPAEPLSRVLSLYLKSSRPDDTESPLRIAELYEQGREVPPSLVRAWAWYDLAAARSSAKAAGDQRDRLARSMNQVEQAESKRIVRELKTQLAAVAEQLQAEGIQTP